VAHTAEIRDRFKWRGEGAPEMAEVWPINGAYGEQAWELVPPPAGRRKHILGTGGAIWRQTATQGVSDQLCGGVRLPATDGSILAWTTLRRKSTVVVSS